MFVLWSNKTKFELFADMNSLYVGRKPNEAHARKSNIVPIIKHEGKSIMFGGCFTASGPEELLNIQVIMAKGQCLDILNMNIDKRKI